MKAKFYSANELSHEELQCLAYQYDLQVSELKNETGKVICTVIEGDDDEIDGLIENECRPTYSTFYGMFEIETSK